MHKEKCHAPILAAGPRVPCRPGRRRPAPAGAASALVRDVAEAVVSGGWKTETQVTVERTEPHGT
ncbi:hypothetical protein GCM10023082_40180 [Streptomyces tremellae]|uniref:Uncharacterized protein n=1 Tax=Streptomyces tremellae TaxID=1124239 RepID=A0ABP7FG13_9ACTN